MKLLLLVFVRCAITGMATAVAVEFSQAVILSQVNWRVTALSAVLSAIIRLVEYLRRFPDHAMFAGRIDDGAD